MRGFGFFGAIGLLLFALIAGVVGYGLGVGAGVPMTSVPVEGAPVVYYGHPGWGGFGFFGFFLFLIIIFVVIGAFRRAAWGHRGWGHGYGTYGRHGWGDKSSWRDDSSSGDKPMPPFADEMLGRWHREAHGEPDTAGQPGADKPGSTAG